MQGDTILKNYTDYKNVGHSSDGSIRPTKDLDLGIDLEITLTVKDFLDNSIPDGEKQFSFLIWDKTQGTTPGVNSQHADINIQMNVMLKDTTLPTVTRTLLPSTTNSGICFSREASTVPGIISFIFCPQHTTGTPDSFTAATILPQCSQIKNF